ncbi:MAG: hypothetical protein ACYSR9_03995, partial [Planctomycetota bacterium]
MKIVRLVPKFANTDDVLKKYCRKYFKAPCSLELVYLPFVLFRYRIDLTLLFGKKKTEKGLFLVDLLQGIPINIKKNTKFVFKTHDLQEKFRDLIDSNSVENKKTTVVSIEPDEVNQEQVLPIVLDEDTAIKKGKNLLMYDLMKLTGSFRYKSIDIIPEPERKILYYPHWLIYYRDKKNQMRFDVLDGLNGQKEGGQIIRSIKIGLVEKHKTTEKSYLEKGVA